MILQILRAMWPFVWDAFVGKKSLSKAISETPGRVAMAVVFILSIALNSLLMYRMIEFSKRFQNCKIDPTSSYSSKPTADLLDQLEQSGSTK